MQDDTKASIVSQEFFPGCFIEPKWSRIDLIRLGPYYALRMLLSDKVTLYPRGRDDFVSLMLDGKEYVIEVSNFKAIEQLKNYLINNYFLPKGWSGDFDIAVRANPDLLLDAHLFVANFACVDQDIPLDRTKMFWLHPSPGASGYYRSALPAQYQDKLSEFYTEHREGISHLAATWFDAFAMHIAPTPEQLSLYQTLHNSGKVLMYEYDDDIFNIPNWNPASQLFDAARLARAKAAMHIADLIVGSTERLRDISPKPDVSFHGPNLVDCSNVEVLQCATVLDESLKGYYPIRRNKELLFLSRTGPDLKKIPETYNPVKILWAGSSTHEKDLKQLIDPVLYLGKVYGLSIRFIFFGYCPMEFLRSYVEAGNTNHQLVIKDEYSHFMDFVPPVKYHQYAKSIESINPDISLCPLVSEAFNLAKSNLKVIELGAMGIPSIVSDYGPYEFIEDYQDGIKVVCEDKSGWVKSIEYLINNVHDRRRIASNIRERVWRDFSWNNDSENRRKWDTIFGFIHQQVQSKRDEQINLMNEAQPVG